MTDQEEYRNEIERLKRRTLELKEENNNLIGEIAILKYEISQLSGDGCKGKEKSRLRIEWSNH